MPKAHELHSAKVFADFGHDVRFLKPSNIPGVKNGDIIIDGKDDEIWEVKAPTGNGRNTIHNNIQNANKQSKCLIFDLYRSKMPDVVCINRIRRELKFYRAIKRVKVITRSNSKNEREKIIDLK